MTVATDHGSCRHADTFRGEDSPRRWGSDRTQVCAECGMYRRTTHFDQPLTDWLPASQYLEDIAEDEDA